MGQTVETFQAGWILLTPHPAESYPGIRVVRPGPQWDMSLIVTSAGQSFVALGGEKVYAYETIDGARAQAFELQPGDRARLSRSDLPHSLAEWRIERAVPPIEE